MLGSGRLFCKQVDSISKVCSARSSIRNVKVGGAPEDKVVIPPRIERGPTDILKALSSTVGMDPTGFPYKYPDDPFFYPFSLAERRVWALIMESGRKSAKWVIKENPGFFKHQLAEPPIQAFLPEVKSENEAIATEESLLSAIEERNVSSAIQIYESLKGNGVDVQPSTKQSLLELVCFYNSEDRTDLNLEEKWFDGFMGKVGGPKTPETWNSEGFANRLFDEMDQNCPLANSAMIQGMLKYNSVDLGVQLFEAARVKKIKLSVGVYNSILPWSWRIVSERSSVIDYVKDILVEMSKQNVKPNLGTLNAALRVMSQAGHFNIAQDLLKEFLVLGIEPSLGSYGYLFKAFERSGPIVQRDSGPRELAQKVMNAVEIQKHEIRHPSDFSFFVNAMETFVEVFCDGYLVMRLLNMYLKPDNLKFIVRAGDEAAFFKQLFLFVFKYKPIEEAMELYRRHVFVNFYPVSTVLKAIISAIRENRTPKYLAEVWEDLTKLTVTGNRPMMHRILQLQKDFTDEGSLEVFHKAAISYWNKFDEGKSGDEAALQHILAAFMTNDDEERVLEVVEALKKSKFLLLNLSDETPEEILDYGISKGRIPVVLESLRLASQYNLESTSEMAEKALPLLTGTDAVWAMSLIVEGKEGSSRKEREEKRKKKMKKLDEEEEV